MFIGVGADLGGDGCCRRLRDRWDTGNVLGAAPVFPSASARSVVEGYDLVGGYRVSGDLRRDGKGLTCRAALEDQIAGIVVRRLGADRNRRNTVRSRHIGWRARRDSIHRGGDVRRYRPVARRPPDEMNCAWISSSLSVGTTEVLSSTKPPAAVASANCCSIQAPGLPVPLSAKRYLTTGVRLSS